MTAPRVPTSGPAAPTSSVVHRVDRDTQVCLSLAGRPSNIGTRFHNHLYAALGLNYLYKAFTTDDLAGAIGGIRALGLRGCGVSMPYKEACIPMLDRIDESAAAIDSVNTVVNDAGVLTGYNTDYTAIARLLIDHRVDPGHRVAVLGSGGMAKAVVAALHDGGHHDVTVVARNETTGRSIADRYDCNWRPALGDLSATMVVNATPVGMAGGPAATETGVPAAAWEHLQLVFDVVAFPAQTPLIQLAQVHGIPVITGDEVISLQALEQFVLYTGVRPSAEQVAAAAAYSRS